MVRKRGPSTYQIRVYLGQDSNGKRQWATRTVKGTLAEARRAERAMTHGKDHGRPPASTRLSVEAYLRKWLKEWAAVQVQPRTLTSYTRLVNAYIVPALGLKRLASLNGAHIQSFAADLTARGLSPRTVRYTLSVLRQALSRAVHWGLIPATPTPAGTLALPKLKRKPPKVLTPAQVSHLFTVAAGDRLEALWPVAVMTGLRPGEYLALRWSDVNLTAATVTVRRTLLPGGTFGTGKTAGSRRTVTLPASTVTALKEHKRRQAAERLKAGDQWEDGDLVFCTAMGRPLDHNNVVHYHFKPLLKRAGLPSIPLYNLRHTGATLLLEAGENLKVVSERLGHASITLTADTYSHVSPTMQARSAERLDAVLAGAIS